MIEKPPHDPDFEALLTYIQQSRDLDFRGYKRTSLRRRITMRMEAVGVESFGDYQSHLEAHPSEFGELINTVLINVTSFFRDPDAWGVLRSQLIPDMIATAGSDRAIRIWSVGCASGEEPYSIAMLFADVLGVSAFCDRVKIYATDLDESALHTARSATYTARDVEGVPPEMLDKYFERTSNHYVFQRDLRKCVIFGQHNIVRDAPISRIDLLVCRNLLIYLENETQDVVLPRLHYALLPTGYLFLGKAETQLARSQLFRPIDMRHRMFRKVPQEWRRASAQAMISVRDAYRADLQDANPRLLETIVNDAGTAYLVIDPNGLVVLANSTARQLLNVSEGDIGRPFQDLPISYRPLELRGPIEEAINERRPIRLEHQEYFLSNTEALRLTIEIRALYRMDAAPYAILLSFADTTRLFNMQRELVVTQESLENSIEELQSANEELETTNEELQSTNEELETTNEELQSTNEELETINEEFRSSNEEMESANEELRIQSDQAVRARIYLESILRSLDVGVMVVDGSQVIQSWNRWCENTWGLRAEEAVGAGLMVLDVGFPTHDLCVAVRELTSRPGGTAEQVIEAVDRRGRPITCLVRLSQLHSNAETGAVVVFQDVSDDRKAEAGTD